MGIFDSYEKKGTGDSSRERRQESPTEKRQANPGGWRIGDKILDRYKILDIKKGGMGIVNICCDVKSGAWLALKTLRSEFLENQEIRDQFRTEAIVWIRLGKHANIVRAFQVLNVEGRPYIAMEYVPGDDISGPTLYEWIQAKRLNLNMSLRFAIQICDAMSYAHDTLLKDGQEFVHRDLKPLNVLIGQNLTAKVVDFGLVAGKFLPWVTNTNIAGTLSTMSPEQCRGEGELDLRSDIYAMGCILFEMLTGHPVFAGNSLQQALEFHKSGLIPPVKTLRDEIPVKLNDIIVKCLSKDKEKRYHSFSNLRSELATILKGISGEEVSIQAAQPLTIQEIVTEGFSLIALGMLQDAIKCFDDVLARSAGYPRALLGRALCLYHRGFLMDAYEAANKSIKAGLDNAEDIHRAEVIVRNCGGNIKNLPESLKKSTETFKEETSELITDVDKLLGKDS